jgi:hypothetical protein
MSRHTAPVLALRDYRSRQRTIYFTRGELNQLLGLYSRHVARGIWRDYAIDHRDGMALFSVFRHTHEGPAYRIVKSSNAGSAEYIVFCGRQRLAASPSLADALAVFGPPLSLVSASPG